MHLKSCALTATALFLSIPALPQTPAPATKPKSTTTAAKPAAAATSDRALLRPALLRDQAPETYQVKFDTTRGEFTVTVTRAWSPLGADRFYNLAKHHYFDNARFFRVLPNFVVQFGLSANPTVNAAWEKATIKDDPRNQSNKRGSLVFATAGPNTRTTQLFINLKDNGSSLDSQGFTPFGQVDGDGMKVVEMLYDQYGESAGMDQENITKGGEKYIATHWPKLDTIKSATLFSTSTTTPAKPAAKSTTSTKPAPKPTTAPAKPQQ